MGVSPQPASAAAASGPGPTCRQATRNWPTQHMLPSTSACGVTTNLPLALAVLQIHYPAHCICMVLTMLCVGQPLVQQVPTCRAAHTRPAQQHRCWCHARSPALPWQQTASKLHPAARFVHSWSGQHCRRRRWAQHRRLSSPHTHAQPAQTHSTPAKQVS